MPKRKPIPKDTLISASADAAMGLSTRELMAKYPGISERVIRILTQNGVGVEEWRESMSGEFRSVAAECVSALRSALRENRVSPNFLATAAAICTDKAALLDGRNAIASAQTNIQVNFNGGNVPAKEDMIAILTGRKKPSQLLAEKRGQPNPSQELSGAVDVVSA